MASNSKKRRRVLGASCILAALIIASSSFAWFTSKDEVTNRLSANADYDVKIVESFTPPKNFLPGQEVNKDEYAVNTGSIAAFVKETVTSKMTVTREKTFKPEGKKLSEAESVALVTAKDEALQASKQELTKLTAAERYSVEAGSFLALAPAGSSKTAGEKIVAIDPNSMTTLDSYTSAAGSPTAAIITDFTPDVNGLYVFRRTIDVGANQGEVTYRDEDFTYEAYYYVDGQYYKVKLTSITPDNVMDIAGDKVRTDGILSDADGVMFYDETTVETPELSYDPGAHELIARVRGKYGKDLADDFFTNPTSGLNKLGKDYDDAIHAYEEALAQYLRAYLDDESASATVAEKLADLNAAKLAKEIAERNLLAEEAHLTQLKNEYTAKYNEKTTATTGIDDQLKGQATTLYGADTYSPTNVPGTPLASPSNLYNTYKDAETAKNSSLEDDAAFKADIWAQYETVLTNAGLTSDSTTEEMVSKLTKAQIEALATTENHHLYENTAKYYAAKKAYDDGVAEYNRLLAKQGELADDLASLKSSIVNSLTTAYGSGSATAFGTSGDPSAIPARPANGDTGSLLQIYNAAVTTLGNDSSGATQAYNEAVAAQSTNGTSQALTEAYNAAVGAKNTLDQKKLDYELKVEEMKQTGDIIVHIGLKNDVTTGGEADKWQLLPADEYTKFTNPADTAVFYYTSLLAGGETSAQLIDYVTLDKSVTQDMYKYFDFDLDIDLNSAQVTYAKDNTTVTDEAAEAEFAGVDVDLYNAQDESLVTLNWKAES